jgi:hypothetical protein
VVLEVGIEVGTGAQHQGAVRLGRRIENKVDEQLCVSSPRLVLTAVDLRQGVKLLPLVDIEEEPGAARVVLETVAN